MESKSAPTAKNGRFAWFILCVEAASTFCIYFLYAASPPPNVNESHYLAKAKHYWNPQWCPDDLFLNSADAHLLFYWTIGWITMFCSLVTVAWIGRVVVWLLTALAWNRLSRSIIPSRFFAPLTAGIALVLMDRCHMAGEWMIGGIEAKGFAYPLVLLGLSYLVEQRWKPVWIWFGAAAAFHVLVGGWSVVAAVFAWSLFGHKEQSLPGMLPWMVAGLTLSLAGLIPALSLTMGGDPNQIELANQIYVLGRLPHHLVFSAFEPQLVLWHVTMALAWLLMLMIQFCIWLGRKDVSIESVQRNCLRLNAFVLGTLLICLVGIGIDRVVLGWVGDEPMAARLLRYYWFRMSDIFIPIGFTFTSFLLAQTIRMSLTGRPIAKVWQSAFFATVVAVIGWNMWLFHCERVADPRPRADRKRIDDSPFDRERELARHKDWLTVCRWVAGNTPDEAVFLTPPKLQTFKWYAGRSEVVNQKDVPQDAEQILKWQTRLREVHPRMVEYPYFALDGRVFDLLAYDDETIRRLATRYGATYAIVNRDEMQNRKKIVPTEFDKVFPNGNERNQYTVLKIDLND